MAKVWLHRRPQNPHQYWDRDNYNFLGIPRIFGFISAKGNMKISAALLSIIMLYEVIGCGKNYAKINKFLFIFW